MIDSDARDAEDAELVQLRQGLIDDTAAIAALEAARIRKEARVFEIAETRMQRQRESTRMREMELRSIALELGAPLRIHDRAMQNRLTDAARLSEKFPSTLTALSEGRISRRHADVIVDAGLVIDDPVARAAFEKVVLDFAEADTPNRTRAFARQLAEQLHPRSINERFAEANDRRLVTVTEVEDGMAELCALLPDDVAFGIVDRLTRMAKELKGHDDAFRRTHRDAIAAGEITPGSDDDLAAVAAFDERTRDQTRADLLGDLLLTAAPAIDPTDGRLGPIRGHVQITVPASTLAGTTAGGAELNGRCAVDDLTARRLAGNAPSWDRVFTDPITGTVFETDRYEPLSCMRRFLDSRDVRCRAPGCRRPARGNQIDHQHEWQHGGKTRLDNLAGFCVRHHTLKTESGWTVRQIAGGRLLWTSPLGFTYKDDPPPRVVFVPDDSPAPF